MSLGKYRELIDQIDEKIIQLLNERAKIARQVGVWKIENGHPIFVPEREKALLAKLKERNSGPLSSKAVANIYREIISGSIALEQPLKIACVPYTSNPLRHPARLTFGDCAEYKAYGNVSEVFSEVEKKICDYGVVSFADGAGGFDSDTIDALLQTDMKIVAERLDEQGVSVLVIGAQSPVNTGDDRTAFRAVVMNGGENPGFVREISDRHNIDILCFEVRTPQFCKDSRMIFAEFAGHPDDPEIQNALDEIAEFADSLDLLGGYPVL